MAAPLPMVRSMRIRALFFSPLLKNIEPSLRPLRLCPSPSYEPHFLSPRIDRSDFFLSGEKKPLPLHRCIPLFFFFSAGEEVCLSPDSNCLPRRDEQPPFFFYRGRGDRMSQISLFLFFFPWAHAWAGVCPSDPPLNSPFLFFFFSFSSPHYGKECFPPLPILLKSRSLRRMTIILPFLQVGGQSAFFLLKRRNPPGLCFPFPSSQVEVVTDTSGLGVLTVFPP